MVVGRHVFDMTNDWEGTPPAGEHVVVVSHRPRPEGWHPEAPYHFVDDVAQAIAKAKELAGDPDVVIRGDRVLHLRYRVRR
jgi:dihydrofolate reductase